MCAREDFRTWGGTVQVAQTLALEGTPESEEEAEHNIRRAIDAAADRLNNTRAVARASYVHPRIPDAYRDGELLDRWKRARRQGDLDRPERLVLSLLTER